VKTLQRPGVQPMIICTCTIFFEYRIGNKIMVLHKNEDFGFNLAGCFLLGSHILQVLIGYVIIKWLKGRKFIAMFAMMFLLLLIEIFAIAI
jgi:hypothetical protein